MLKFQQGEIVELFDAVKKNWTQLKNLPFRREDYNVNIISNKLLIIGNYSGKNTV